VFLTRLPAPVVLRNHVDAVEEVVPEFLQVVRLGQAAGYPRYDDLIHDGPLWTHRRRRFKERFKREVFPKILS